jgi:hypothetical protein
MSCPARAGDYDFKAATFSRSGVFEKKIGRAMSRHYANFERYAEGFERLDRMRHRLPVRFRSHYHAD